ncbi:glycerol kinase GlpK [Parvularcula lutaonensis]|uniref:Glycerol kinase GlpK n=1 Tax=Parvularcula lutaonensis TaxID=491923 RepID=A0ABV7M718_9PROT|nr:glycerol kinase GlpK [Parvularcula lutaonensis]GGY57089.1 glycerol kinase [Parvularcula lutaonensis]
MTDAILAIDQGTTSSRAIIFSPKGDILATAQEEFEQLYPGEGMVEHDPEAIWSSVLRTAQAAFKEAHAAGHTVLGIGITNQRETIIVWDRKTGEPIHNAIVWQDRRTSAFCRKLVEAGHEPMVQQRAGLLLDPYFSASKLAWLLDNVEGARQRAEAGELAAGTVDTWLLWKLTGGRHHKTDATNACRTCLFNLAAQDWDDELLKLFGVPKALLPQVEDSAADFGFASPELFGTPLPILSMVGDQQGATVGQACFRPGDIKSTYGTGCFVLVNTGEEIKQSKNRLLSTVAYRIGGKPTYAVEGSIFIAGAAVQWLRDELRLLKNAAETAERAERAQADAEVVMVPAFTGMGAPYWSPDARAAVFGMTRSTGPDELARAALEGVIYQTRDLVDAMAADGLPVAALSVDGGMAANDWFVQRLSDILDLPVDRPKVLETTALGAAYLAFLQAGTFGSLDEVAQNAVRDRSFAPKMEAEDRERRLRRWRACVEAVLMVAKAG